MRNINRPQPKSIQYCRWAGYMSMPNFRIVLSCITHKMPRNPISDRLHKAKNSTKMWNINKPWSYPNQFWKCSGYISMPYLYHYFHALLQKCVETSNLSCSTNILACGIWKFDRWSWKINKLFHPMSSMLPSNSKKLVLRVQWIIFQHWLR